MTQLLIYDNSTLQAAVKAGSNPTKREGFPPSTCNGGASAVRLTPYLPPPPPQSTLRPNNSSPVVPRSTKIMFLVIGIQCLQRTDKKGVAIEGWDENNIVLSGGGVDSVTLPCTLPLSHCVPHSPHCDPLIRRGGGLLRSKKKGYDKNGGRLQEYIRHITGSGTDVVQGADPCHGRCVAHIHPRVKSRILLLILPC